MDIASITAYGFIGLFVIGAVNVIELIYLKWKGVKLEATTKIILSFVFAFAATFVPVEIGNMLYDKALLAIQVVGWSSGVYKLTQKAGGQ